MEAIYKQRDALKLDAESLRLVEFYHREFVHAGANLSDADKTELKKMNEEISTLENDFKTKLLAATQDAAYATTDKDKLAGLSDAQLAAAAQAAKQRKQEGWVLPLQNTTQQPYLADLSDRATRQELFEDSWNRAERGGPNDTARNHYPFGAASRREGEAARLPEFCRLEAGRSDGQDTGGRDAVHG